ncbi:hypothetical protein GT037_000173 [Alternaria burnsii]|uniref:Uncharacterized protein n=1 Tax=Alternaria burnsii TaxID=1187904 RepID=A0A8H7BKH6_9PLEO|nr:uncharacterized protein GT037_000173 [Alternaria burnsii]KAF7681197.1 hypothetical protein GT037_000173 [Alternaria burnsii]
MSRLFFQRAWIRDEIRAGRTLSLSIWKSWNMFYSMAAVRSMTGKRQMNKSSPQGIAQ